MSFASRLRRLILPLALAAAAVSLTPFASHAQSAAPFAIKSGDRVVFYGDSITEQRMYTLLTEEYIVTRFPDRDVTFFHSGWGGDRVTGGGGGPIDLRLDRDVTPFKPTVVTIMLGMNDGSYQAYNDAIFKTYADGYKHLADKIKQDNPGVRLTFIQPSPYDDVTQPVKFDGGYNAVLQRFAAYDKDLAASEGATVADFNTPVVAMLTKANATDAATAQKILPDRVHPSIGGHLIMAEALLKSWNAPAIVSSVTLDAKDHSARAENASVKGLKTAADGSLTWTESEGALPFPIQPLDQRNGQVYKLALDSSDFVEALDQEPLTVANLTAASYTLKIDGQDMGIFTKEQLAAGVNLSTLPTPMLQQAELVAMLSQQHSNLLSWRWREVQVPLAKEDSVAPILPGVLSEVDASAVVLRKAQREAARPRSHAFALTPRS